MLKLICSFFVIPLGLIEANSLAKFEDGFKTEGNGVPCALAQPAYSFNGDLLPVRPENPPFSGGSYGSRIEVNVIQAGGGSLGGCQSFYRCCWAGGSQGPCHPATNQTPGPTPDRGSGLITAITTTSTGPSPSKKPANRGFVPEFTWNPTSSVKDDEPTNNGVTLGVTSEISILSAEDDKSEEEKDSESGESGVPRHYKTSRNCFWNLAKATRDECGTTSKSRYIHMYESFKLIKDDHSKTDKSSFLEELAKRSRGEVHVKFQHRVTCCLDEHKSKIHEYSELDKCHKCRSRRTLKKLDRALHKFHKCLLRKPQIYWNCEREDE